MNPATKLTHSQHSAFGWRPSNRMVFARSLTSIPLSVSEISRTAHVMPVGFASTSGTWKAFAVMGVEGEGNCCLSVDGSWRVGYVPALLRTYPFTLDDEGILSLAHGYTPEPLGSPDVLPFFEGNQFSEKVLEIRDFLKKVHKGINAAHAVLTCLNACHVLVPWPIAFPFVEGRRKESESHPQWYRVDKEKLKKMDLEVVMRIFRAGDLRWLYAHIDSCYHAEYFSRPRRRLTTDPKPVPAAAARPDMESLDVIAALKQDAGDVYV